MDDAELEELRQKRIAEIQSRQSAAEHQAKQEVAAKQQIEALLKQILTPDAMEQWGNLKYRDAMSGTSYAHQVALLLVQAAQNGQVQGKINKEQLKRFLQIVHEKTHREISINVKGLSERLRSRDDTK